MECVALKLWSSFSVASSVLRGSGRLTSKKLLGRLDCGTYLSWMARAAGSRREVGMIPPAKGRLVTGSRGLLVDWEKSPSRSRGVGTTALLR